MSDPEIFTSGAQQEGAGLSDARLVEDAHRGNKDAFGILVQRYERRLVRVILRFCRIPNWHGTLRRRPSCGPLCGSINSIRHAGSDRGSFALASI